MSRATPTGEKRSLPPDEAFSVLGNETRIQILKILAEAENPLAFSELFERVDYDTSTNFSYHLEKLEGHFVRKTESGYELGQIGNRVVQAILSGTVTEAPEVERTPVDHRCEYCGGETEISYAQGYLGHYCTECSGNTDDHVPSEYQGYLRGQPFPPAGLQDRQPADVHRAAFIWGNLQRLSLASAICPICSAKLHHEVEVCEHHRREGVLCQTCGRRRLVSVTTSCSNCKIRGGGPLRTFLLANTEFLAFLTMNGVNPFDPSTEPWVAIDTTEEEILSRNPLTIRVTFGIEGDLISLTVEEGLDVTDVSRDPDSVSV